MQPNRGCGVLACASRGELVAALAAVLLLAAAPVARGQSDNFNDGNDTGWSRYSPLGVVGAPATFSFPNGGYRIQAPTSPDPGQFGPARAGSFRQDATYSQFYVSVDMVDWDNTLDQAFGILARVSTPGLGTTDGYAFSYSVDGSIDISLVNNEAPTGLGDANVMLDPAQDYRLVFEGNGPELVGRVFDLRDLITPVATATGNDATYASGIAGVFIFDNSGGGQPADATFDNYLGGVVPEPGSAALLVALGGLALRRRRRA
jgi:hypothetical protein